MSGFKAVTTQGILLVVDGVTTKLSLVPSGILRPNARCLLGSGVVIDPKVIIAELESLRASGIEVDPTRLALIAMLT